MFLESERALLRHFRNNCDQFYRIPAKSITENENLDILRWFQQKGYVKRVDGFFVLTPSGLDAAHDVLALDEQDAQEKKQRLYEQRLWNVATRLAWVSLVVAVASLIVAVLALLK